MTITARTSLRGVAIAARNDADLERVRSWSESEGHAVRFEEFRRQLARRPPK